ncbi:hypothetical protein ACSMXN_04895 [Jatrophihabitans sp. DSM 45814]
MAVFIGYGLIAVVVAALLFYAVVALLPDGLSFKPQSDRRPFELPADRRMVREDLDVIRIPVTVRGYRFAETDDLIDRLAAEIVVRDEEIARLRGIGDPTATGDSETYAATDAGTDTGTNATDHTAVRPATQRENAGPAASTEPVQSQRDV